MKADQLTYWDQVDLAKVVARRFADMEDLLEAASRVEYFDRFEVGILWDYIQQNWQLALSCLDPRIVDSWLQEKQDEEEFEALLDRLEHARLLEEIDEKEEREVDPFLDYLKKLQSMRVKDLPGLYGYPAKKIVS